jgi:hypothetical protein
MAESSKSFIASNLGFVAWLVYGVLAGYGRDAQAAIAGLIVTLLIVAYEMRAHAVKIVDCTSLAFFVLALAILRIMGTQPYRDARIVMAWGIFALMAWATILIGFPFTVQYAREQTARELWERPEFRSVNMKITLVWALIFTFSTILALLALEGRYVVALSLIIPGAAMVFGFAFSRIYPERLRRHYETASAGAARAD